MKIHTKTLLSALSFALIASPAQAALISTINANNVTYTDLSGPANTISLGDMQTLVTTIGDLNYAAVFNSETGVSGGDFTTDADYPGTAEFGISGAVRYGNRNSGNISGRPSGTFHSYLNGTETWTLTPPSGGLITHFGFMGGDYTNSGSTDLTATAHFSGGGSQTLSETADGWYWFGFVAPTGESITSVVLQEPAIGDWAAIDDIVVVSSVPEPSSFAMTAIGLLGLVLLRRQRH